MRYFKAPYAKNGKSTWCRTTIPYNFYKIFYNILKTFYKIFYNIIKIFYKNIKIFYKIFYKVIKIFYKIFYKIIKVFYKIFYKIIKIFYKIFYKIIKIFFEKIVGNCPASSPISGGFSENVPGENFPPDTKYFWRKFPQGNFPGFVEIKHLFTAVKLYFFVM